MLGVDYDLKCQGWLLSHRILLKIIDKSRKSSGSNLHGIWSLCWRRASLSSSNWEDLLPPKSLQGTIFLSFCFWLLMSATQNIVWNIYLYGLSGGILFRCETMPDNMWSHPCLPINSYFSFLCIFSTSQMSCLSSISFSLSVSQTTFKCNSGFTFYRLPEAAEGFKRSWLGEGAK